MKTQIIILIVVISIINPVKSFCQWDVVHDYGQTYNFKDIFMSSDSIGYITAGNNGISGSSILKTYNYGNTWNVVYSFPSPENPSAIFFINDTIGFIAVENFSGIEKIYKTTNGGVNFTSSNISDIPSKLFFPSDSIGYLFCRNSYVYYKTTDCGSSWSQYMFPYSLNYHPSVYFLNNDTGFVVNNDLSKIYKTIDGGFSWNIINVSSSESLNYIHFINDTTGFLNSYNVLWKTTNSGDNWVIVNDSSFNHTLYKTQFINDTLGYALGSTYYTVLKTTNGGINWHQQYIDMSYYCSYIDMQFMNDTLGFIIGGNGIDATLNGIILKTINGGENSTTISNKNTNDNLLLQNYPNPFINSTIIEYKLNNSFSTDISICIYNIFGQQIKYYSDLPVSEKNQINIEMSNYPSGIYYYSFIVDGQIIETKKMICVKD